MNIINRLASSLQRRDEAPNQELAKEIVKKNDKKAIKELMALLDMENKSIQSDVIKVLYEIGEQKPSLISEYAKNFVRLLADKNNRLQWGAMSALDAITSENPAAVYKSLTKIIDAADAGSVITRDRAF